MSGFRLLFLIFCSIAVVILLLAAASFASAQTQVDPAQVKSKVVVVEWAKCNGGGTYPDGSKWDCTGMEMYRFRLADGTVRGPYIAVPVDKNMTIDQKWTREVLP